ncbi:MAG: PD40 domain-containing protein [Anaerolineae bacterium]|nr:PD40 domain-containing protein [Anaerolineae bacterium]
MANRQKQERAAALAALTGIVGLVLALLMAGWGVQAQGIALPTPTPTLAAPADLPEYGVLTQQCGDGVSPRGPDFAASGFIITTFSRDALWVIDLARGTRYPLPDTRPCGPSCRPSPDRTRLLYVSPETATYWTMRPDGFERVSVFPYYVSELDWWDADHWLAWPTAGEPAIYPIDVPPLEAEPLRLNDYDVYSIQPGGFHGLRLANSSSEWPVLEMVHLADGSAVPLVEVQPYFGAAYWSPDGSSLAYIGQGEFDVGVGLRGAEVFVIAPGENTARRITNLTGLYGASRLTGASAAHALSWSPDGRYLAFWVLEIIGPDMAANVGQAVIHVLDTQTGKLTAYCGFATNNHDPVLPEPVWSPDGRYIAFGVDEPGDERPALLLVLDTMTGDFTEVSEGMVAAYGTYDPVMWGVVP